jgi:hypothetical protein
MARKKRDVVQVKNSKTKTFEILAGDTPIREALEAI